MSFLASSARVFPFFITQALNLVAHFFVGYMIRFPLTHEPMPEIFNLRLS
jgi:hypothetical protein